MPLVQAHKCLSIMPFAWISISIHFGCVAIGLHYNILQHNPWPKHFKQGKRLIAIFKFFMAPPISKFIVRWIIDMTWITSSRIFKSKFDTLWILSISINLAYLNFSIRTIRLWRFQLPSSNSLIILYYP